MGMLAANAFSSAEHICLCLLHSALPSRQLPVDWSGVKPGGEANSIPAKKPARGAQGANAKHDRSCYLRFCYLRFCQRSVGDSAGIWADREASFTYFAECAYTQFMDAGGLAGRCLFYAAASREHPGEGG